MSEPTPGPGADLKAARESLQVSIREVADALNLPTRVIEALESDDYDRLPPTVFTRGYLRSYARLLELPSDQLLARYPEVTEEVEIASDTLTGTQAVVGGSRRLLLPVSAGVVVLIALLVWLLSDEGTPPESPPASAVTEPESRPAGDALTPEARPPAESAGPVDLPGDPSAAQGAVEVPAATAETARTEAGLEEPAPAEPGASTEPVAASTPPPAVEREEPAPAERIERAADGAVRERRITEFGDDRLVLRFTEDCWVEVKSLDGANLYSDLNRAGTTLELTGRAPFRVLLGYAPGVSLDFNGEPIGLSRYSRNNVASLVLGQ